MRRQAPLTKSKGTEIGVQKGPKCAKPCKMCTPPKKNTFLDAQASSTSKTHKHWSAKSTKMCKTMQNVRKSKKKRPFGCPGKLHLQNAQKLEYKKHNKICKTMQNVHKSKQKLIWMPRQAPLTKRTEIGAQKTQKCAQKKSLVWMDAQASSTYKTHRTWSAKSTKMCKTMQNVRKSKTKTFLDAQASSTYKTHRNWSAKNPKMCTKKITCVYGCPGKLHLQNAQNLECKKHKNMQNHAKSANKYSGSDMLGT